MGTGIGWLGRIAPALNSGTLDPPAGALGAVAERAGVWRCRPELRVARDAHLDRQLRGFRGVPTDRPDHRLCTRRLDLLLADRVDSERRYGGNAPTAVGPVPAVRRRPVAADGRRSGDHLDISR